MLSRILPILSLIAACVLGWYLYSSGTLDEILAPKVATPVAKRQLVEGQVISARLVEMVELKATEVRPGMITFPAGSTPQDVEKALAGQKVGTPIPQGKAILASMLGQESSFVILRTKTDVQAGDSITLRNIEAVALDTVPPPGVVVFDTQNAALAYINEAYDLKARSDIFQGHILTITDTAGSEENSIFVVRTNRGFDRAEALSIDGLEVVEIPASELARGAIAFPTAPSANLFIAEAGSMVSAIRMESGDYVTAATFASERGLRAIGADEKPQTIAELMAYQNAYPERSIIVERNRTIGEGPKEGRKIDFWVEAGMTEGAFGEYRLERIAANIPLQVVYLNEEERARAAGQGADASTSVSDDDQETRPPYMIFWAELPEDITRRFKEVIEGGEKVAFAIGSDEVLVDVIGNGALCLDDVCKVNVKASNEMKVVKDILAPLNQTGDVAVVGGNTLTILNGVNPEMADMLVAQGYDTLESIATWTDEDLQALAFTLNISPELGSYLRRQAQIITESPETARRELGFGADAEGTESPEIPAQ